MITSLPDIIVKGTLYTPNVCIELVRSLLSENDNEKLSDLFIRSAINLAKSDIANRLTLSEDPWYLYSFNATLDTIVDAITGTVNSNATQGIDLSILAYNSITPTPSAVGLNYRYNGLVYTISNPDMVNIIHKVKSVSLSGFGSLQSISYEELQAILNNNNTLYKKSGLYCHEGRYVYVYNGSETVLFSTAGVLETDTATIATNREDLVFGIIAYRTPLLDDLLPSTPPTSTRVPGSVTINMGVDIPDRHIRILLLMVQKICFEMLGKVLDPNTDNLIEQGINALTQKSVMLDKAIEAK